MKKEFEGVFKIHNEWEDGPNICIDDHPIYSSLWDFEGKIVKITVVTKRREE